jgi:hypothetical protein
LGCSGIDIDWEETNDDKGKNIFAFIVQKFRGYIGPGYKLSAAVFSTGAFTPVIPNTYVGLNVEGLVEKGDMLDWINLMAYDAGKDFNVKEAYFAYKKIFKKPIYVGLELGKQGWGDAILSLEDIDKISSYIEPNDGLFIWGYGSLVSVGPTYNEVISKIKKLSNTQKPTPPTVSKSKTILVPEFNLSITLSPMN